MNIKNDRPTGTAIGDNARTEVIYNTHPAIVWGLVIVVIVLVVGLVAIVYKQTPLSPSAVLAPPASPVYPREAVDTPATEAEIGVTPVILATTSHPTDAALPAATDTPAPTFTGTTDLSVPPTNAQFGDTWTRPTDGMVMVYIPAGNFLMGSADNDEDASDDEKPQNTVTLDAYWIDRTEVTNAMFRRFVSDAGYTWGSSYVGEDDYPVVNISWDDASAYCAWAGGRLPTEAQWEKAARGTDGRLYPWGDQPASCEYAVMNDSRGNGCGKSRAWPVGSKPNGVSPYGVLDMAGNAWEWVKDWYSDTYYQSSPSSNPTGPGSGEARVLRGGSWYDYWRIGRAAYRHCSVPALRGVDTGFRCSR